MTVAIDETQVRRIARLARLKLTEQEVRLFAGQLATILEYVKQIESLDTEGVEPLAHALPICDVLRDDVPTESVTADQALVNAPAVADGHFRVPAVLDPGAGA